MKLNEVHKRMKPHLDEGMKFSEALALVRSEMYGTDADFLDEFKFSGSRATAASDVKHDD